MGKKKTIKKAKAAKKKAAKAKTKNAAKKAAAPKKKAKAPKKSRPRVKVTIERKALGKAPERYSFYLQDGRRLESIYELIDELETMSEDMFRRHVDKFNNDFANWIEHVFEEKTLAEELRLIRDRMDTQRALLKHLVRELTKELHEKR